MIGWFGYHVRFGGFVRFVRGVREVAHYHDAVLQRGAQTLGELEAGGEGALLGRLVQDDVLFDQRSDQRVLVVDSRGHFGIAHGGAFSGRAGEIALFGYKFDTMVVLLYDQPASFVHLVGQSGGEAVGAVLVDHVVVEPRDILRFQRVVDTLWVAVLIEVCRRSRW